MQDVSSTTRATGSYESESDTEKQCEDKQTDISKVLTYEYKKQLKVHLLENTHTDTYDANVDN